MEVEPSPRKKDPREEGLRYRKKMKARLSIEKAALELVIERGFEKTTVEDICARAEISKKTFFNYFPSKAAAIVGSSESFPDAEGLVRVLDEFAGCACYLDVLANMVRTMAASGIDQEVMSLRHEALRLMPQLLYQGHHGIANVQKTIVEAMRTYLAANPERRMAPDASIEEESLMAASMAIGLARTGSMLYVCGGNGGEEPSAEAVRTLIARYLTAAPANSHQKSSCIGASLC